MMGFPGPPGRGLPGSKVCMSLYVQTVIDAIHTKCKKK